MKERKSRSPEEKKDLEEEVADEEKKTIPYVRHGRGLHQLEIHHYYTSVNKQINKNNSHNQTAYDLDNKTHTLTQICMLKYQQKKTSSHNKIKKNQ